MTSAYPILNNHEHKDADVSRTGLVSFIYGDSEMLVVTERSIVSMLRSVSILFVFCLYSGAYADEDQGPRAHYLANTGVMISHGQSRVLFDPLFSNTFGIYDSVPTDIEAALLAGLPPWHGIDAVFISHYHEDHIDPALILELLSKQVMVELYAPVQAIRAVRKLVDDPDDSVLQRMHGIDLENGTEPLRLVVGPLLIEAVRIPHDGWPRYHQDVENIVFRVTLDDATTVMHFGDADPSDKHFAKHTKYWQERHTHFAMPPYWFFFKDDGQMILDERIGASQTVGVHVPSDVPNTSEQRSDELRDVDLFTQPGETRHIGN